MLRLARALEPYDDRPPAAPATATATTAQPSASGSGGHPDSHPGVHQLVYYSSGVGSEPNFSSWTGGITGAGLVTKVEEAYSFICMNWAPGDEASKQHLHVRAKFVIRSISLATSQNQDCWG